MLFGPLYRTRRLFFSNDSWTHGNATERLITVARKWEIARSKEKIFNFGGNRTQSPDFDRPLVKSWGTMLVIAANVNVKRTKWWIRELSQHSFEFSWKWTLRESIIGHAFFFIWIKRRRFKRHCYEARTRSNQMWCFYTRSRMLVLPPWLHQY